MSAFAAVQILFSKVRSGWRFTDSFVIALGLNHLRNLKHVTQPFVLNHRALVHLGQLVVFAVWHHPAIRPQLDASVRIPPENSLIHVMSNNISV